MKFIICFILSLACLSLAASANQACRARSATTTFAGSAAAADPLPNRYNVQQTSDHVNSMNFEDYPFAEGTNFKVHCVDSRADYPIIGAPGGDMGMWFTAQQVYWQMRSDLEPTFQRVYNMFAAFVESEHVNTDFPFYYHTDDTKMRGFLTHMANLLDEDVTIFPSQAPANADLWLEEIVDSQWQGCGHIRLALASPSAYNITYPEDNPGLIEQRCIQSFISYLWEGDHPDRLDFNFKLGTLVGKAVAIVGNDPNSECGDEFIPTLQPNHFSSQIFVYTPSAVAVEHHDVYRKFYAEYDPQLDIETFIAKIDALHNWQLGATLSPNGLNPANQIDLFSVNMDGETYEEDSSASYTQMSVLTLLLFTILAIVF